MDFNFITNIVSILDYIAESELLCGSCNSEQLNMFRLDMIRELGNIKDDSKYNRGDILYNCILGLLEYLEATRLAEYQSELGDYNATIKNSILFTKQHTESSEFIGGVKSSCIIKSKDDVFQILKAHDTLLFLNRCNLSSIRSDAFNCFTKIEYLDLSNNKLEYIHPDTFANLHNLEILDLPHNQIKTIHNTTFDTLSNLKSLDLSYNKGIVLEPAVFKNLTKLADLYMSWIQSDAIPFDLLKSLPSLYNFDFLGNNLTKIESSEGLTTLNTLDLRGNAINEIGSVILKELAKIKFLYLPSSFIITD